MRADTFIDSYVNEYLKSRTSVFIAKDLENAERNNVENLKTKDISSDSISVNVISFNDADLNNNENVKSPKLTIKLDQGKKYFLSLLNNFIINLYN